MSDTVARLLSKIREEENGCWTYTGALNSRGYGAFWLGENNRPAHRVAYEYFVGSVPRELHLDHLCRNRACCNPEHLEPVTCRENLLRGETHAAANAAKTHCPEGHPLPARNAQGRRVCRDCSNEKRRRRRAAGARG